MTPSHNYSCGTYSSGNYNQCATSSVSGDTGGVGGVLANTGYAVLVPMALAGAILIAAVIFGVKRWLRRQSA